MQEKIAALNGKRKMPLRVGGQALHVNVSDRRIAPDVCEDSEQKRGKQNVKKYQTWNTMHPITLQLNVTQLWTLFRALALYHSKGYTLGDDIAKDIWVQLREARRAGSGPADRTCHAYGCECRFVVLFK